MRTCRFCKQGALETLFSATTKGSIKRRLEDYACTSNSFGVHGPIVKCQNCGIIYVNDNSAQREISTYYKAATDPVYLQEQEARKATFEEYLLKLHQHHGKGKLLDIGTNTGLFVKLAADSGWDAAGLEPNRWAVEYARKTYGINIINKPFDKGLFKPGTFDAVTMWDVIEHFTDPVGEIKKVYDCLKTDGVFAFSTVDPESILARLMGTRWSWYMEMHRVFFTRTAATRYLLEAGFRKIEFASHWRKLSAGYLATRLEAVSPAMAKAAGKFVAASGFSRVILPYYANDLFDCYAYK